MELISVIVPVYKVEPYLDTCMESIVNQTYSNLEIFLIDDGSPDRCPEICDRWAEKDPRIRVVHKKTAGCPMREMPAWQPPRENTSLLLTATTSWRRSLSNTFTAR